MSGSEGEGCLRGRPGHLFCCFWTPLFFCGAGLCLGALLLPSSESTLSIALSSAHTITHTHTSAPHAEAYTCCWPCSWCCFHNLSFDVNHARTHHVMMCQTMPSFYTFLTIYLDVTSGTRAPESLMLSLKQLQAQADNNLLTADEEETEHVCKQLTILPTQSQACMAAGSMHTKAKIGCWL